MKIMKPVMPMTRWTADFALSKAAAWTASIRPFHAPNSTAMRIRPSQIQLSTVPPGRFALREVLGAG